VPGTVTAALACVVALGLLASGTSSTLLRHQLVPFAVAAVATGLAGADPALDRTAAVFWPVRRAVHVAAIGALSIGALVASRWAGEPLVATELVVRNGIGLTGVAALGATLLGGGLAWCLPMTWTTVAVTAALASREPGAALLTWPVQPAGTTTATVAATVLGVGGTLVYYALRGPSPNRTAAG
jgi:hypothetical protein